jgi:hypothetical protein
VATNESIVAIFGIIIPEPLATPVIVIVFPEILIFLDIILLQVSVVKIEFEKSIQLSLCKFLSNSGKDFIILPVFILSPITPVEKTRISSVLQEAATESFLQYFFMSFKPSSPVPAFAFPELTIRYLGQYLFIFSFVIITDGDFALFFVKTPAIFEPLEILKLINRVFF